MIGSFGARPLHLKGEGEGEGGGGRSGQGVPRPELPKSMPVVAVTQRLFSRRGRRGQERYMKVQKFNIADASLTRSPGQEADIFVGNLVDEQHGGPVTIGYGRYAPDQSLAETMAVDDVMIVLEGRLSVSTDSGTVTAGPGEIVYMPKGQAVTIRSHEEGAVTAYVTYPHWRTAHA